jgi:N-terminal domain on NACHT_NTPase and P-loop NTPases
MSGVELLGGIAAVITIIDSSVKVWESARKELKFNPTFETVDNRLPILRDILQTCYEHLEPIKTSLPADAAQDLMKIVDDCKRRAEKLDNIFQETIPGEDDRWYERYHRAAQQQGKESKVEDLMRAITENAQNLLNYSAVKLASPALHTKLREIAEETASLSSSPSSTVPFRRDVDFVDRETSHDSKTLLERIEQQCKPAGSRVALVGIGGAG